MRFFVSKNLMFLLITLLILLQPMLSYASTDMNNIDSAHICLRATQMAEKKYNIKKHLLTTIASVETGRWDEKTQQKISWPWTINAQGKGYFFDTKAEAVRKVKELRAQGVQSIDVGCMQINLSYHGHEFNSIEEALDPIHNVEYAAKFLSNLYENGEKDWLKAAMAYHSSSPAKANKYRKKIVDAFEAVKMAHNDIDATLVPTTTKSVTENKNALQNQEKKQVVKIAKPTQSIIELKAKKASKQMYTAKNRVDVNAWREAKLEEYRVQKLLARKY